MSDHVAKLLEQWARERPDLDASPMGVIGRLHRLAGVLESELRPTFAAADLGDGDFDLLATLRRAGAPYELSPSEMAASSMVTSSAITKRIDRLERAGHVVRERSADDGRGRRVRLTDSGLELIDRLVGVHLENERRLLAGLTPAEQASLADLLQRWAVQLGT